MKVSVRNLGVIKEASFDLKSLTVFIGPNNAGKTWLAYSLAGILSSFGSSQYTQAYTEKRVLHTYEPLDTAIERVLAEGNATIDLRQFAEEYGERYFNDVAQYAKTWMGRFLGTQLVSFDNLDISLSLTEDKAEFLRRVSQYSRTNLVAGSVLTIRKSASDDRVFVFTTTDVEGSEGQTELLGERIPLEEVKERLVNFIATALRRSLYPHIAIFPTERTTLVTARFAGNVARTQPRFTERAKEALEALTKELEILTKELAVPDIRELAEANIASREATWPISSFLSMLNTIFANRLRDRDTRERQAKREPLIKRYIHLAEILEKEILAGGVDFSTPEPDPRREVLFQPTQDTSLEMPIASSMVKELAPLVLYLRHLAQPGELLIIDEPEMNLHPTAQVKIIEFLAMLVNAGLHVLITTHSPYIVDHLVNLMDAYKHQHPHKIAKKFLLQQRDAFIPQEQVAAYLVEKGKVTNILEPEGLIDWSTFSEESARVQRIHFELVEE